MKNKIILLLSILIALFGCSKENEPIKGFSIYHVKLGDIKNTLEYTGQLSVKTAEEFTVSPTSVLKESRFNSGDKVNEGDVIAVFIDESLTEEFRVASTDLELKTLALNDAKKSYNDAKKEFSNQNIMFKKGITSERELASARKAIDQSATQIKNQEAALSQAQTKIKNLEKRKNDLTIIAQSPGSLEIVYGSDREVKPIKYIISDNSSYQVRLSINEVDVVKIKEKQAVDIQFEALPRESFTGKINLISNQPERGIASGSAGNQLVTYKSEIEIEGTDERLRSGMTAKVQVNLAEKKNVIVVPIAAIQYRESKPFVYVVDEKNVKSERELDLGLEGFGEYEVAKGLQVGEKVAIPQIEK